MNPSDVYVLIPACHRPAGLRRAIESLFRTAPDIGLVVATDPTDQQGRDICADYEGVYVTINNEDYCGAARAWNNTLAAAPRTALAYVLGADDLVFLPGWLDETLWVLEHELGGSGYVGLFPGGDPRVFDDIRYSQHYLMTRDFVILHNGGVMACPHYWSYGLDNETAWRAHYAWRYGETRRQVVDHVWMGRAPNPDKAYTLSDQHRATDKAMYFKRREQRFPDDFDPIITK